VGYVFMPGFLSKLLGREKLPREEPPKAVQAEAQERGVSEEAVEAEEAPPREWIGVDLDGTLAYFSKWKGLEKIGKPIPNMVTRVNDWIAQGYEVKVMTARASVPGGRDAVRKWLKKHNLPELEVTCQKDFHMVELWDDRAVQVMHNRGQPALSPSVLGRPRAPLVEEAFPHENRGEIDPNPPEEEPDEEEQKERREEGP